MRGFVLAGTTMLFLFALGCSSRKQSAVPTGAGATLYFDAIIASLSDAARKAFEAMNIKTYEFQSEWARNLIAQGRAEGEARGEARGKAEGEATAILRVLQARGILVSPEIRDRIAACTDLATLDRWIQRAVVAASAADVVRDDS